MLTLQKVLDFSTPQLAIYRELRDRAFREDNSFIADSPKVVNLLLQSDVKVVSILATAEYYEQYQELILNREERIICYVATKKELESIVGHKIHHNCMLHGIRPEMTPLHEMGNQIIMLDEISSSENIGSIARSAAALGVNSYLLPKQGPHPFNRRALRVSMGLASRLKTHQYDDIFETLAWLKKAGYTIYGAEVAPDAIALSKVKVPSKWVLLMGHEGKGLSQEVLDACDDAVEIEMQEDIKSFNVAVAASIILYTFLNTATT